MAETSLQKKKNHIKQNKDGEAASLHDQRAYFFRSQRGERGKRRKRRGVKIRRDQNQFFPYMNNKVVVV